MKEKVFYKENYSNINYTDQRITNSEFDQCTFQNCDFSNSKLSDNDFINCLFEGCNFAMALLNGSGLKDVRFKDCKLIGINFDYCADFLFAVNFQNCVLDYASFTKKKMKRTNFLQCSLKEADFTSTDLAMAVFANSDLSRAVFQNSNLEKADLLTAVNYTIDPEKNKIAKAKFSYSGIAGLLEKYHLIIE